MANEQYTLDFTAFEQTVIETKVVEVNVKTRLNMRLFPWSKARISMELFERFQDDS